MTPVPTIYTDTRGREWTIRPVPFWGWVAELAEADGGHIRAYAPEEAELVRALDLVPVGVERERP